MSCTVEYLTTQPCLVRLAKLHGASPPFRLIESAGAFHFTAPYSSHEMPADNLTEGHLLCNWRHSAQECVGTSQGGPVDAEPRRRTRMAW